MKTRKVSEHLKEELKDAYFKELYELEEQKFSIVKMIIAYRIKNNLNQSQLADRVGVTQQFISKIENGDFSSLSTLGKVMLSIGYTVKLEPVPLTQIKRDKIKRVMTKNRISKGGSHSVSTTVKRVGTKKVSRSAISGKIVSGTASKKAKS